METEAHATMISLENLLCNCNNSQNIFVYAMFLWTTVPPNHQLSTYIYIYIYMPVGPFAAANFDLFGSYKVLCWCQRVCSNGMSCVSSAASWLKDISCLFKSLVIEPV